MDFKKDNDEIDWHRDDFDFDAFLKDDSLDDRITAAVGGKELLEPDAISAAPDYIPRRSSDPEHGRHEAPGRELPNLFRYRERRLALFQKVQPGPRGPGSG